MLRTKKNCKWPVALVLAAASVASACGSAGSSTTEANVEPTEGVAITPADGAESAPEESVVVAGEAGSAMGVTEWQLDSESGSIRGIGADETVLAEFRFEQNQLYSVVPEVAEIEVPSPASSAAAGSAQAFFDALERDLDAGGAAASDVVLKQAAFVLCHETSIECAFERFIQIGLGRSCGSCTFDTSVCPIILPIALACI
jgi:hypothetical protein